MRCALFRGANCLLQKCGFSKKSVIGLSALWCIGVVRRIFVSFSFPLDGLAFLGHFSRKLCCKFAINLMGWLESPWSFTCKCIHRRIIVRLPLGKLPSLLTAPLMLLSVSLSVAFSGFFFGHARVRPQQDKDTGKSGDAPEKYASRGRACTWGLS